ncbi:aldo/keto reductase [Polaromonas jejuensis]|uniref:Aldo/keto reductase n=1 Tax=Polaromonas jejuensis TaxID=457502 RepID=A0ABW0QA53_9BURK
MASLICWVCYSKSARCHRIEHASSAQSTTWVRPWPRYRNTVPRFAPETRKANRVLVDLVGGIASQKRATPAQIALTWLLAQKTWIVPIPGTTKLHRLKENVGATDVELSPEELREINDAVSNITVQGGRYAKDRQQLVNR